MNFLQFDHILHISLFLDRFYNRTQMKYKYLYSLKENKCIKIHTYQVLTTVEQQTEGGILDGAPSQGDVI